MVAFVPRKGIPIHQWPVAVRELQKRRETAKKLLDKGVGELDIWQAVRLAGHRMLLTPEQVGSLRQRLDALIKQGKRLGNVPIPKLREAEGVLRQLGYLK
jgi:hypothetical protein